MGMAQFMTTILLIHVGPGVGRIAAFGTRWYNAADSRAEREEGREEDGPSGPAETTNLPYTGGWREGTRTRCGGRRSEYENFWSTSKSAFRDRRNHIRHKLSVVEHQYSLARAL